MQLNTKQLGVTLIILAILMAITRGSHFGSSFALPDASLAVFLLSGYLMPRLSLTSIIVFAAFIFAAGAVDYFAISVAGVDDACITPAYLMLIPTYAVMWVGGSWFAKHQQNSLRNLPLFAGLSWLTTTLAFVLSNSAFFLLSGRFAEMSSAEYSSRVAQYYLPYLAGSMLYLTLAASIYIALCSLHKSASGIVQR